MKTFHRTAALAAILLSAFLFACGDDDDNPAGSGQQATRATLTHEGFDFSAADINQANTDGETIVWMPGGGDHAEHANGTNIWWRNSHLTTGNGNNQTKDMGVVDLASITAAPTTWDENPGILPLLVDHVIVARCADGYVKFKVVSTDTTGQWPAVVDFVFSTTSNF